MTFIDQNGLHSITLIGIVLLLITCLMTLLVLKEPIDEKPDMTVQIPFKHIVLLIIALSGLMIFFFLDSKDRPKVAVAMVMVSLLAATITFGALGAAANIKTAMGQFGGSAGIFIGTLLTLLPYAPQNPIELYGKVHVHGDKTKSIENVTVHWENGKESDSRTTNKEGRYFFPIPSEYLYDTVSIWATPAQEYFPSQFTTITLAKHTNEHDFELESIPVKVASLLDRNLPRGSENETMQPFTGMRIAHNSLRAIQENAVPDVKGHADLIIMQDQIPFKLDMKPSGEKIMRQVSHDKPPKPNEIISFWLDDQADTQEASYWFRLADGNWKKRSTQFQEQLFITDGTDNIDGDQGQILNCATDPALKIFLPNRDSKILWIRKKHNTDGWSFVGPMQGMKIWKE